MCLFGARQCSLELANVSAAIRARTASSDVISGERRARAAGVLICLRESQLRSASSARCFSPSLCALFLSLSSHISLLSLAGHGWAAYLVTRPMIRKKRTRQHQEWTADEDTTLIRQEIHPDSPENTVSATCCVMYVRLCFGSVFGLQALPRDYGKGLSPRPGRTQDETGKVGPRSTLFGKE